jgi:tetratricopeptide (TPR) repeat protein
MKSVATLFSLSSMLAIFTSFGATIFVWIPAFSSLPPTKPILDAKAPDPSNLYQAGDYTGAIQYWRQTQPVSVTTKTNLGCALAQQQQLSDAITEFQAALKLPATLAQQARIYYNLGNCYFLQENRAAAIAAYQQALKCYPGDQLAKYNLEIALRQPPPPPSPPPATSPPPPSPDPTPTPNNPGNAATPPPRMNAAEAEQLLDALQQHERGPQLTSPRPHASIKPTRDW